MVYYLNIYFGMRRNSLESDSCDALLIVADKPDPSHLNNLHLFSVYVFFLNLWGIYGDI